MVNFFLVRAPLHLFCLVVLFFFLPFNFSFALVLKETLENRGVLGQIRARVRAEVFGALDDQVRKWDYCRSLFDLRFI